MTEGGQNGGEWAASESKDWKMGRHRRENRWVNVHAGEIRPRKTRRSLSVARGAFERALDRGWLGEGWPAKFEETEVFRDFMEFWATEGFHDQVEEGDAVGLRSYVGSQESAPDISGIKAIGKVDEILESPAPVISIIGKMGAGKTDLAGLFGQRMKRIYPNLKVGTNIRSLEEKDAWIRSYPELLDWISQDGDPIENDQTPKLFIGDEFSSSASGVGKQGHQTRTKMGPTVFKIRKYHGNLIYIGHGEKSLHPILYRVGYVVKKESKKKATVAHTIKNAHLADIETELHGIPRTDWNYNTREASDWSWERLDGTEEIDKEAAKMVATWTAIRGKENGLSTREIAKFVPFSKSWVGKVWKEYQDSGKHQSTVDAVEATIA